MRILGNRSLLAASIAVNLAIGAAGARADTDLYLSSIVVYAKVPEGSREAEEFGSYPEIDSYDLHGGLAPDRIDVVVVVNGHRQEPVTVALEATPVVGLTNWRATEGVTELQLLERSKTPLSTILHREKQEKIDGRTEITFADLPLSEMIARYKALDFWPAELVFRCVVEPVAGETALDNNVMELRFPINPPD